MCVWEREVEKSKPMRRRREKVSAHILTLFVFPTVILRLGSRVLIQEWICYINLGCEWMCAFEFVSVCVYVSNERSGQLNLVVVVVVVVLRWFLSSPRRIEVNIPKSQQHTANPLLKTNPPPSPLKHSPRPFPYPNFPSPSLTYFQKDQYCFVHVFLKPYAQILPCKHTHILRTIYAKIN